MSQVTFIVEFEGIPSNEASELSQDIRKSLIANFPNISVERLRGDQTTMDFGNLLQIILAAPAVITALELIIEWIKKYPKSSITIKNSHNEIVVKNITHQQAFDLAKLNLDLDSSEKDSES